jgi:biopolymer transport protein ExbB
MAETKPTATVKSTTATAQPKRSGNSIAWIAPLACILLGYVLWRFVLGNEANFTNPDRPEGFGLNMRGLKEVLPVCMKVVLLYLFLLDVF